MADGHLKICVSVLTYRRPDRLDRLLRAFLSLGMPEDCSVFFLVVDNDPDGSAQSVVEAFNADFSFCDVRYVVEREPGIPAARNRALDEALSSGADLLCFTDDDAWPHHDWLVHLVACYRRTKPVLVFGPQRLTRPPGLRSPWKRMIARSLEARSRFLERFCEYQARRGQIATSGTYNWLGELRWIFENDLRFDPFMRDSGGSDTAFRESARKMGASMAWCCNAVVSEEVPVSRLSLRYQFYRARMQGMNAAQFHRPLSPKILQYPLGRIVVGVSLFIFPVLGMASFSLGLHQLGMGVGVLYSRFGERSNLYKR